MPETPGRQFAGFLSRYDPAIAQCALEALGHLRALMPGAVQLVYDNYNALVVAFGPSERASEAVFSLALYPRWVTLFIARGFTLRDPDKILQGAGKFVRHIVLQSAEDLDRPAVQALMGQALAAAGASFENGRGRMVIRSISAKQRPRRPAAKAKSPAAKGAAAAAKATAAPAKRKSGYTGRRPPSRSQKKQPGSKE